MLGSVQTPGRANTTFDEACLWSSLHCSSLSKGSRTSSTEAKMATTTKGLTERAQRHLATFISAANKRIPHPLDDERFYAFIRVCHIDNVKMSETEVAEELVRGGFDEEMAESYGSKYCDGRALLNPLRFEDVDR